MPAVWYRARADLRRGVGATIALILFVAIPGGIVLATLAGAVRTHDALPEFRAYNRPYNLQIFIDETPQSVQWLQHIRVLPQWEAAAKNGADVVSVRRHGRWVVTVAYAYPDSTPGARLERPLIIDGRLADPDRAGETE